MSVFALLEGKKKNRFVGEGNQCLTDSVCKPNRNGLGLLEWVALIEILTTIVKKCCVPRYLVYENSVSSNT